MRAVTVTEFGGPQVLQVQEVETPKPGPGQVLVDVEAIDVLDLDTKLRAGLGAQWGLQPPFTPGGGVAGTVSAVGDDVDAALLGQRVVGRTADAPTGGYAEQALVPADRTAVVPDGVDSVTAAALAHDGVTTFALLDRHPVGPDDRVLILAAGGGAASLLVQRAAAAGATVVGAARGARKLEAVRRLGASAVVDYGDEDWVDAARQHLPDGATVVFDGVGGVLGRAALERLTALGGRFSAHGAASGGFSVDDRAEVEQRLGITVTGIEVPQSADERFAALLDRALAAAAGGRPQPQVGLRATLDEAAEVHRALEAREVVGTAVLTP